MRASAVVAMHAGSEAATREVQRGERDHEQRGDHAEDLDPCGRCMRGGLVCHAAIVSRQTVLIKTKCLDPRVVSGYGEEVPRIWNDTIEEHRRAVHDAVLDAAE